MERIMKTYWNEQDGNTIIDNHGFWGLCVGDKLVELGHSFDSACLSCFWQEIMVELRDLELTTEMEDWVKETDEAAEMPGGSSTMDEQYAELNNDGNTFNIIHPKECKYGMISKRPIWFGYIVCQKNADKCPHLKPYGKYGISCE